MDGTFTGMFVTRLAGYSGNQATRESALYRVGYWISKNQWSDAASKNGDKYHPCSRENVTLTVDLSENKPEMVDFPIYYAEEAANLVNYLNGGSSAQ